nr:bifunctional adenosylcobinamide kinase/adenosylcobinamide-phosphate guanylyltransferase [Corynebacterium lactis]
MRTLVLGGARSGKSAWAERELLSSHGTSTSSPLCYIATARPWPGDADFEARIAAHRSRRQAHARQFGATWRTLDDADAATILAHPTDLGEHPHVLLDDVGTWITHLMDSHNLWECPRGSVEPLTEPLVEAVRAWPEGSELVIVSPEVGFGVIPEHRSGRLFRDEIGLLNQKLAAACDRVVLVVAGCPMVIKEPLG